MLTPSQTLNASGAHKRYFGQNRSHGDALADELSPNLVAEGSSGCAIIFDDLESRLYGITIDLHSASALVGIWRNPESASDVFRLNAQYEVVTTAHQAFRIWHWTENPDAFRAISSAVDLLNTWVPSGAEQGSVREPVVEEVPVAPTLPPAIEVELEGFSAGLEGKRPTEKAVLIARQLSIAAVRHVSHPDITVDIDGELSFDLRLDNGQLIFAELGLDGRLDVGVYGSDNQMLHHDADATCTYLLSIIKS